MAVVWTVISDLDEMGWLLLLPVVLFKKLFLPRLYLLLFLHFLPETYLHLVGELA